MWHCLLFLFIFLSTSLLASTSDDRPTIGLVLSGGGARAAAHIGVIEVLEEMGVPIDLIVGTSMGAVIGGLYAAGVPISQLKNQFCNAPWDILFSNTIDRKTLYYRRKRDSDLFFTEDIIGIREGRVRFSVGLINGQNLYQFFKHNLGEKEPIGDCATLPIPFKAVATDLLSGKMIILEKGDLARNMLASMAVPGIMAPIPYEDQLLVDGGINQNLPVALAREMGADIIIAVDCGTPLYQKDEIKDIFSVLWQLTTFIIENNAEKSKRLLSDRDILIAPHPQSMRFHCIDTTTFDAFTHGIMIGREAAEAHAEQLQALGIADPCYPTPIPPEDIPITKICVEKPDPLLRETYSHYLGLPQIPLTPHTATHKINRLYGLKIFRNVFYEMTQEEDEKCFLIKPILKSWGPIYLHSSLLLESNFQTSNYYTLALGITHTNWNHLLGEWRVVGFFGEATGILAEIYQPLTTSLTWFLKPTLTLSRQFYTFYDNYAALGKYVDSQWKGQVALGRLFESWGQWSLFLEGSYHDFRLKIGGPTLTDYASYHHMAVGTAFEWDTLDDPYFPKQGTQGIIRLRHFSTALGEEQSWDQLQTRALLATSFEKHTFALYHKYQDSFHTTPDLTLQAYLGGPFRLSGLINNSIRGRSAFLTSLIYYYRVGSLQWIPNKPSPFYWGASLETGHIWGVDPPLPAQHLYSASLFVGFETLVGPLCIGFGLTTNGHKALHLTLGPIFK